MRRILYIAAILLMVALAYSQHEVAASAMLLMFTICGASGVVERAIDRQTAEIAKTNRNQAEFDRIIETHRRLRAANRDLLERLRAARPRGYTTEAGARR